MYSRTNISLFNMYSRTPPHAFKMNRSLYRPENRVKAPPHACPLPPPCAVRVSSVTCFLYLLCLNIAGAPFCTPVSFTGHALLRAIPMYTCVLE
jgi:hypothetical protein